MALFIYSQRSCGAMFEVRAMRFCRLDDYAALLMNFIAQLLYSIIGENNEELVIRQKNIFLVSF